ncbi:TraR/DksA family transcriptional regulator [Streptomyces fungicidicus]|uniref:TraR/DksA family transcriptional regulator n=1 Tax=Streptomyces TaxID=1883 RepID=UPI0038CF3690
MYGARAPGTTELCRPRGPPSGAGRRAGGISGGWRGHKGLRAPEGRPAGGGVPRCRPPEVDLSSQHDVRAGHTGWSGPARDGGNAGAGAAGRTRRGRPRPRAGGPPPRASADETQEAGSVVAKKTGTAEKSGPVPQARAGAEALAVRPGEDPWTEAEAEEARAGLRADAERIRTEIDASGQALAGLMRDSGGGAGDDEADTGTKNITREHELSLAANAREMLRQTEQALVRLDEGTYGTCENCGNPIGKARLQAFPRATLCVDCKQKQERRG